MVREHLVEEDSPHQKSLAHGMIQPTEMMHIRWNSQIGTVYIDGSHSKYDLELGDEVMIDGHAPRLQVFESP